MKEMSENEMSLVSPSDLELLREIGIQTFKETFASYNSDEQIEAFFNQAYSLPVLKAELEDPYSETYFLRVDGQVAGFLKLNWGKAQTEAILESAFEVQRLYLLKTFQGQGLGKYLLNFALQRAKALEMKWIWLGVWEHNLKAQALYTSFGFEKFSEHVFKVGDKSDIDWLLKKSLL